MVTSPSPGGPWQLGGAVAGVRAPTPEARFGAIPGAASLALATVLSRSRRAGRVAAVFPAAVYLDMGEIVIAVVTCDAVRLPNAIVIAASAAQRPFRHVGAGSLGAAGEGDVVLGHLIIHAARWWNPQVDLGVIDHARVTAGPAAMAARLAVAPRQPGLDVPPDLGEALRAEDQRAAVAQARALVGRGPGLTPSGDDILGGALAAFRALGGDRGFADSLATAVAELAPGRTTALSTTLLRLAAHGSLADDAAAVLRALVTGDRLQPTLDVLLGLGHTSGADVAAGLMAGGTAGIARQTARLTQRVPALG
jgi:hypothetical protein